MPSLAVLAVLCFLPAVAFAQDSTAKPASPPTPPAGVADSAPTGTATHAPRHKRRPRHGTTGTTKRRKPPGCAPLGSTSCADSHLAFRDSVLDKLWPVKGPDVLPGSILPAKRIVAFYGNPLSKRMGILGEFPLDTMLRKLDERVASWQRADPKTPVVPALHLIAVVAQGSPGRDGKYRLRMDSALVERVYGWAQQKGALLFLDVQLGQSTLQAELPHLAPFLKRPSVHLAIDPEFSMHHSREGQVPGRKIGSMDAADVNYASQFLQELVSANQIPPKVLVVHRFTKTMVKGSQSIKLDPRVQIVMDMDGFGAPWLKQDSYWSYVKREPVQFAGWKQFTKLRNDRPPTPDSVVARLFPSPLYIQYQ